MELPTPRTARNSSNPMVWGSLHYISSKGRRVLNFTKQGDESGTGGYLFGRSQECDEVDYGTYVNGIKIGLGNTIRLHDKDQITFVTKEMTTTAPDGRHLRRRVLSSPYVFASAYPSHDQSFDGQYRRGRSIGIGNSATVFTAQDRKTKALRAVKVIKKRVAFDARTESRLEREISILMAVNHPNLIKVTQVFNEKSFYYIVMEYARGGELFDLIQNRTKFTESETRHIFKQVFSGVQYLHERGIIHRDLKPENILVADQETLTVKISDFGMAKMTSQDTALNTFCGTTNYNVFKKKIPQTSRYVEFRRRLVHLPVWIPAV
ncbi:hypothetical protein BGZ94_008308 [Podila epigama]|nr:hypothetical protein BGZ94_008308 [Podila epigama]